MALEQMTDEVGNIFEAETTPKGDIIRVTWVAPGPDQQAAFSNPRAVKTFTPQSKTWGMLLENLEKAPPPKQEPKRDGVINSRAELAALSNSRSELVDLARGAYARDAGPTGPSRADVARAKEDTTYGTGAVQTRAELERAAAPPPPPATPLNTKGPTGPSRADVARAKEDTTYGTGAVQTRAELERAAAPTTPSKGPTPSKPAQDVDPGVQAYLQDGVLPFADEARAYYRKNLAAPTGR